ncbi:MAG: hypothetical protein H7Y43_06900 [Akkermansiaceae bacterium]|nr:hypothetical protein [Verrucomicrobiales bacterium]
MPNSDDILKSAGVKIHEDKKLGRFYGPGRWRLNGSVDFPFQEKVSFTFELTQSQQQFPESMARNVEWLLDNMGEIWNTAAVAINEMIEAQQIKIPPEFVLGHFWAFIPNASLVTEEWRVEIEPRNMVESFEVVFRGLKIVSHKVLTD